jgi:hypothetical protein
MLPTIYIIYNAKSTLLGKLNYVYRKASCPDPATNPACAACELTHGPSLSLSETQEWKQTKSRISNANVVQVHLDERPSSLFQWMKKHGVDTPAVIVESTSGSNSVSDENFKALLTAEDLSRVRQDHEKFLEQLHSRILKERIPNIKIEMP